MKEFLKGFLDYISKLIIVGLLIFAVIGEFFFILWLFSYLNQ